MDEEAIDQIFQGVLKDLPRPISKVLMPLILKLTKLLELGLLLIATYDIKSLGCSNFYQFYIHRHDDGEEHSDAVCVS